MQPTETALVTVQPSQELDRFLPVMNFETALQRRATLVRVVNDLMSPGHDFHSLGTDAKGQPKPPSLLQPGAQKLDNLFGLVPRFPVALMRVEEDWTGANHGGEPFFRYMVTCQLMRGDFIMGEAIGECNSWESKYRYRVGERLCPTCNAPAIIKTKHKTGPKTGEDKSFWCAPFKGGCGGGFGLDDGDITGQETGRRPNGDIFDQVNTLIKMAQKRAHIAATINATSASEFFTQDMEDRQPEDKIDTGGHPVGTQAAADHVAKTKIQEGNRKASAVDVVDDPPELVELLKILQTTKGKSDKLDCLYRVNDNVAVLLGEKQMDQLWNEAVTKFGDPEKVERCQPYILRHMFMAFHNAKKAEAKPL